MPVNRPTFNESWYRVSALRPKLRPMVQTYRQQHRGRICQVVHDPSNNNFFRLEEPAYRFVGLLDGKRTVGEVWTLANEQLGDDGPTQNEVIQVLGQLYTFNLLEGDLPADATGLFDRYHKRIRQEVGGYFMNILSMRIPIFDPDRVLDRWIGVGTLAFTLPAFGLWLVLVICALASLAGRGEDLIASATGTLDPDNLLLLYLAFACVKAIHEFGHAFACKRFGRLNHSGGEVHTMGIMLLVLLPMPYVDASSAWAFRSRWQRAIVGAAGMYVELAVAVVAAFIWGNTADGSLLHSITYNVMFVSGVSTLLFNANPLLRYDGYYILSDLLEIPNLAQRSKLYLYYLVKRYVYSVRNPANPANTLGERFWLFFYAIASGIYRVIISVGIILFIVDKLFIVGALMAVGGIVAWVAIPVGKFIHYLLTSSELSRVRARAILATAAAAGVVFVAVGLIRVPDHGRAEGIVEPEQLAYIYMNTPGFVNETLPSGTLLTPESFRAEPLLVASDQRLLRQREQLLARRDDLDARYRQAKTPDLPTAQSLLLDLAGVEADLKYNQEQIDRLQVKAPFPGVWIAPDIARMKGAYLTRGQQLGAVASIHNVRIRVATDQNLGPRLRVEGNKDDLELRVKGNPDIHWAGMIEQILPAGQRKLSSQALGFGAGGSFPNDMEDPKGLRVTEPYIEVWIEPTRALDGSHNLLLPGQRVTVRFNLEPKPLLEQWRRIARQTIQRRFQI